MAMRSDISHFTWAKQSLKTVVIASAVVSGLTAVTTSASVIDRPFFKASALVVVIAATDDETNGGVAPYAVDFNLLTPASSGSAAPDLIAGDGYVFNSNSGFLPGHDFSGGASRMDIEDQTFGGGFSNPGGGDIDYLEDTDRLTPFGMSNTTDVNVWRSRHVSRFLVASNAPFDVFAEASNLSTSGDFTAFDYENIGFRALIHRVGGSGAGRWGDMAQNPAIGGGGIDSSINDLGDMSGAPTKLFDGGRKTARLRGSLLEQSVSFHIRYGLSDAADASNSYNYDFSMGTGTIGADVTFTVYTP